MKTLKKMSALSCTCFFYRVCRELSTADQDDGERLQPALVRERGVARVEQSPGFHVRLPPLLIGECGPDACGGQSPLKEYLNRRRKKEFAGKRQRP